MRGLLDNRHGLRGPRLRNLGLHLLHSLGLRRFRERQVERDGLRLTLRAGTHDETILREVWDEDEYPLAGMELGPGAVVVDAGAQIGTFTLLAAATGARVVALEPSPLNLPLLRRNLADNGLGDRVRLHACALARPGSHELDLYLTYTNLGGHSAVASIGPRVRVPALSLEELFEREGIERCRLLKLDVEGLEGPVLASAPPALLGRVDALYAEVIDHPATEADRRPGEPAHDRAGLTAHLQAHGFRVERAGGSGVLFARRA